MGLMHKGLGAFLSSVRLLAPVLLLPRASKTLQLRTL